MAVKYRLRILTPNAEVLDEEIVSMVVPGVAGYVGILANHAPLVTPLRRGTLRVETEERELSYRIGGGVLCVAKNTAVLLSGEVEE